MAHWSGNSYHLVEWILCPYQIEFHLFVYIVYLICSYLCHMNHFGFLNGFRGLKRLQSTDISTLVQSILI